MRQYRLSMIGLALSVVSVSGFVAACQERTKTSGSASVPAKGPAKLFAQARQQGVDVAVAYRLALADARAATALAVRYEYPNSPSLFLRRTLIS